MASGAGRGIGAGLGAVGGSFFGPMGGALGAQLGGAIGGLFDSDDSEIWIKKALEQYEGLVPPDLAKAIVYTQFQQGGQLTPQQLQSLPIEAHEVVKIVESPEMRQKQEVQRQALEQLSRTGMGPQELLALEKVRRTSASDAQARLQSLMGKYQQMGQAGGGASLAAALESGQAADDRAAMEAMEVAAQSARNRREAIQQAYNAASGMRASDLSVLERNAENQRRKQEFDIQNALNRQQWNARAREEANRFNIGRQQEILDKNVAQQNAELLRRYHTAPQLMYQNQFNLAQAKANAYGGRADIERQRAQAQAENWQNLIGAGAEAFGAYAQKRKGEGKSPWSWGDDDSSSASASGGGYTRMSQTPTVID